ncbi:nuclear transport factor 2 family protein [Mycolicibacter arupensis]|jgi:hypothetical protein|uniref:Nuclear transport factor 2 family protein n=1 Tax=Mycolicibacter arupensis TaxID=342002 RepID=A0A0F5MSG2_9MYCO|nr:nuclear transport factor 2 family protein [Mycolicibacter arupensis]KKB97636.1 hypothetical protein WR43_18280 [Mycolicibacter arupensis]MCV7274021.1 nuclear transport factor 2 family protein [Mycolicibacter arupensis]OQZ94610.1 hypothetical protein BST15_16015 [Mycolicibacter arupensis]TXI57727.1 MAG: nuclear transport factor 2 family protein [Mycolicibacter arupensis]
MMLSVADQLQLSALVHRYAAHVDARRFDEVAQLFTVDAELILPEPPDQLEPGVHHRGHDGVRAAMSGLAAVTRTHHGILGEVYAASSTDTVATGEITGVAHHWIERHGTLTDHVWHLHYRDVYHRTEQGWRIAQRSLIIDAIESLPAGRVRS